MSSNPPQHDLPKDERMMLMSELQFLGQMSSTETAHFHQMAAAKNDMTITDSKTVSTLMQEGPMTAGQLAERLCLTTGAITSVIDRLEKIGCVRRKDDPNDRRKVIVEVNPEIIGRHNVYDSVAESFHKLLERYTVEELRFLVEYYKLTIELTKIEISKLTHS